MRVGVNIKSPQHLLKLVGRTWVHETLRAVSLAKRAKAAAHQELWAKRVSKLSGCDYDHSRPDEKQQEECEQHARKKQAH